MYCFSLVIMSLFVTNEPDRIFDIVSMTTTANIDKIEVVDLGIIPTDDNQDVETELPFGDDEDFIEGDEAEGETGDYGVTKSIFNGATS